MFYSVIEIIIVNSYLLSLHAPVSEKKKFTTYLTFRETLYKQLFMHTSGAKATGKAEILSLSEPLTASSLLPPGDTIPVADEPDTEHKSEALATAAMAHKLGGILTAATEGANIKHQKVPMKRTTYVVCKQASRKRKREIKDQRECSLQVIEPNIVGKEKDKYIARPETGCAVCKVSLCVKRDCWDVFYSKAL